MEKIEMVIPPRERDLGGFTVRRILPFAKQRMVGPFIFFDHMGPAIFSAGKGVDVRPHPHINLATVTYLFSGKIRHRDSLGSDQLIEPGAINWMTAGHGIVHSERTPDDLRQTGSELNGIQCWIALPDEYEEISPNFTHYSANSLPEFQMDSVRLKLLAGSAFNRQSPVKVYSDLFYLDAKFPKGTELILPVSEKESAVYLVDGKVKVNNKEIEPYSMAIPKHCVEVKIDALEDSHLMILGGKSIGERFIYWNFVSSSEEKIKKAKHEWAHGPGNAASRFPEIPNDNLDFIPLPEEVNPKGTVM